MTRHPGETKKPFSALAFRQARHFYGSSKKSENRVGGFAREGDVSARNIIE